MNIPKFRAWLIDQNLMCEVDGIEFNNHEVFICAENETVPFSFNEVILMQSTGLTDKNGVEIFCDDIVRVTNEEGNESIHTVYWGGDYPAFDLEPFYEEECNSLSSIFSTATTIEVIGNTHQHMELLHDNG